MPMVAPQPPASGPAATTRGAPASYPPSPRAGWTTWYRHRGTAIHMPLLYEASAGRSAGYDTVKGARIAAAALSRGEDQPALAIVQEPIDRRFYLYSVVAQARDGAELHLHFEHGLPRLPSGHMLQRELRLADFDLVEVRDGTSRLRTILH
jgi:hypothetical protein